MGTDRRSANGMMLGLALFACSSCSSDKKTDSSTTQVNPSKPLGFVAGMVENAVTETPLMGATVHLQGGGIPAAQSTVSTSDKGTFEIGPISAGASFSIRISADGFADAFIPNVSIKDAAGNFPTDNGALYVGPIALIPTPASSKFEVQVVSQTGLPVYHAMVTIETAVRYFNQAQAKGTFVASAMTDIDGRASVGPIPDVRSLPPRFTDAAALVISVSPTDLADGMVRLRGATVSIPGAEVRASSAPPVIVLELPGNQNLQILASNVPRLVNPSATVPALLDVSDSIRVVFNKPIDRQLLLVDLRDETGTVIPQQVVLGALSNILSINPAMPFDQGKKYNLGLRAEAPNAGHADILNAAAPFFAKVDPAFPIAVSGAFIDQNHDGLWGTANDTFDFKVSLPIGRAGATPAFRARVWVELDLNGSMVIGDAPGELPPGGAGRYPDPIFLNAAEPVAPNGAGPAGFTRFFAQLPISLRVPRVAAQGPVNFEVRIDPADNGNAFVTDVAGRLSPARTAAAGMLQ